MLTKAQAIHLFGSVEKLRAALGLKTRQAIYMWGENVPLHHALRIRYELKPEAFDEQGNLIHKNGSSQAQQCRVCVRSFSVTPTANHKTSKE
jgi:hypothetical protein